MTRDEILNEIFELAAKVDKLEEAMSITKDVAVEATLLMQKINLESEIEILTTKLEKETENE